jgi:hypothetical protein
MAILDFIKNRYQPSAEQTAQPTQETAKQMYTREAGEDRANSTPIQLNDADRSSAKDASDLFRKGTQASEQIAPASTPAPAEDSTAPQQPMVQPSMRTSLLHL